MLSGQCSSSSKFQGAFVRAGEDITGQGHLLAEGKQAGRSGTLCQEQHQNSVKEVQKLSTECKEESGVSELILSLVLKAMRGFELRLAFATSSWARIVNWQAEAQKHQRPVSATLHSVKKWHCLEGPLSMTRHRAAGYKAGCKLQSAL